MSAADAIAKLDTAISEVEAARDELADDPTFTGGVDPGSEGHFGPVLHDLAVLRGRVAASG